MKEHASFNRCYRLLWSGTTEQWKPVPETARTAKKGGRGKAANTLTLAGVLPGVAMGLFVMSNLAAQPPPAPPTASATTQLPTGGTVAAGQATISQSAIATAANMVVNQTSQRAVIDWSNFNVGSGATVQFVQPNAQSVILNRVLDANPTQVFGRINANGQVFLTNPYGVYFAPSASVDVGGLVATTYSINNDDFMAGRYTFNRNGSTASVINQGKLSASLGGYIALLAPEVQNSGVVLARAGTVAMAAGEQISLTLADGKGLSGITTTASAIASLIDNKLAVQAPDGQIILSAVAVNKLQAGVIKNSGSLQATSLSNQGGKIVLEADEIELTSTASIDVSGRTRGGTVLMGGDWQGSGNLRQATTVRMAAGATINANATDSGDGGKVVLWSNVTDPNSTTTVAGSIYASAGPNGGNGGQIETSGHYLNVDGIQVSTLAPKGNTGEWLLDPANITISTSADANYTNSTGTFAPNSTNTTSTINNATLSTALGSTNITITTVNNGTAAASSGSITISGSINWSNATTLTLVANDSISGAGGIAMTGGGSVVFNNSNATTTAAYTGVISGNGSVSKQGSGILTLSGANTYSGGTTVEAGTLTAGISNSAATYNSTSGRYDFANGPFGTGVVKVLSGASLNVNTQSNYNTLEIAGSGVGGMGAIYHNSTSASSSTVYGNITLTQDNNVLGSYNSTGLVGLYIYSNIASATGTSYNLTANGSSIMGLRGSTSLGTITVKVPTLTLLAMSSNLTFANNFVVNTTSTLNVSNNSGFSVTVNGNVSGNGTVLSNGVSNINGVYNITGTTCSTASTSSLTINSSTDATIAGCITGAGNLTVLGTGNLTLTGNSTGFTGKLNINTGSNVTIGDGATSGIVNASIANNGTLNFNRTDAVTAPGVISGTGTLNKLGSNVLTLSGNNNFSGTINVNAGTLKSGYSAGSTTSGGLGANATINLSDVSGVTLDVNGTTTYTGSLNGGVNTTLNIGANTFGVGTNNGASTFSGQIAGSGTLYKMGTGTFTLSGWNSAYTGGITIAGGNLTLALPTDTAISTVFTGSSMLVQAGPGNVTLTSNSTGFSGSLTIENGSNLTLGAGSTSGIIGNSNASASSINISNNGTLNFNRSDNITMSGVISGSGVVNQQGTGNLTLSGNNTYAGNTTISSGMVYAGVNTTGGASFTKAALGLGTIKVLSGATFVPNGQYIYNPIEIAGTGAANSSGALWNSATSLVGMVYGNITLTANNAQVGSNASSGLYLYGDILSLANNSYGLTVAGPFATHLVGSKSIRGNIAVSATTFYLDPTSSANVTFANNFTVASGATLYIAPTASYSVTVNGSIAGAGNATIGAAVSTLGSFINGNYALTGTTNITSNNNLTLNNSADAAWAGTISGSGNLTVAGTGNLSLTANSTGFTGKLNVNAGSNVTIGDGATSGIVGAGINDNGIVNFNRSDAVTYAGHLFGSGQLNKLGSNVLTLTGNNTFAGNTTIQSGVLKVTTNNLSLGSNPNVTISDTAGAGLEIGVTGFVLGSLSGGTNATLNVSTFGVTAGSNNLNTTFAGALVGSGNFIKNGSGSLTLSGNSGSYTGNVSNNGTGALLFTNTTVIGNGTNQVQLVANGSSLELQNVTNFANPLNFSENATLLVNTANASLANNLTVAANKIATLNVTAGLNLSVSGRLNGLGVIKKNTDGLVTLSGNNSAFTGTLNVSKGLLVFANNLSLGSSAINTGNVTLGTVSTAPTDTGNGTVWLNASDTTLLNNLTVNASGAITGNANLNISNSSNKLALNAGSTSSLSGVISGPGTLTIGSVSTPVGWTLSGANTFATLGLNSVNLTLVTDSVVNATGAIVSSPLGLISGNTSSIDIGTNSVLDINGHTTANSLKVSTGRLVNTQGTGQITGYLYGGNNFEINVSDNSSLILSADLHGAVSGSMPLIKSGNGTLIVQPPTSGTQIFSGTLQVNAGKLILDAPALSIINLVSPITIPTGSSFEFWRTNVPGQSFNVTDNGLLRFNRSASLSVSSAMNISGTGAVQFSGTAPITWNPTGNNYTGGTTIDPGAQVTLAGTYNFGNTTVPVVNNGNLTVQTTTTPGGMLNQTITGSGNLIFATGTGPTNTSWVNVLGNNTYTGNTTLTGNGTVYVGSYLNTSTSGSVGTGNITISDNTALVFARADNTTIYNNITSTINSTLAKSQNNVTLVLAGNINLAGAMKIYGGTLQIDANGSMGNTSTHVYNGAISFFNTSTFQFSSATDAVLNGNITQNATTYTATLIKDTSVSNLTLNGNNNYTNTVIEAGTLYVGSGGAITAGKLGTGTVVDNASLVFNHSGAYSLSSLVTNTSGITGTGNVTVISTDNNLTIDRNITLTGSNSLIKLMAGTSLAANNATGNVTLSNNVSTTSTGSIIVFAGSPVTVNTTTLMSKMVGASGAVGYKTYNATLSNISSAVAGTRNFFYRIQPTATINGGNVTATKVYDGTTIAYPNYTGGGSTTGIDGDTLTGCVTGASYNTSSAGNKSLVYNVSIVSNNASWVVAGYAGTVNPASTVANITQAPLTIQANDAAAFVTLAASSGSFAGVSYSGFVHGENTTTAGLTGTLNISRAAGNSAGRYALTASGLLANNYHIYYPSGTYTIVPAQQLIIRVNDGTSVYGDVSNLSVSSVTYLMPDNVTIVNLTPSLTLSSGLYSVSDGVGGTASFKLGLSNANLTGSNNAAVGLWNVGYNNLTIGGTNFNSIVSVGTQTITKRDLTVTTVADNKVYDGNTNATFNISTNRIAGDNLTLSTDALGVFASRNAANGTVVTVGNITISGNDVSNYNLLSNVSSTTANITPKTLTLSGLTANNKVYDATVNASIATLGTVSGVLGLDDVQVGTSLVTGAFSDKNVGNGKTVTLTGFTMAGAEAGNYKIDSATTTANITPKALTVSGLSVAASKVYDGTTTAAPLGTANLQDAIAAGTGTGSDGKAYAGDVVSVTGTPVGTYNSKDVATAANVSISGLSLTGAGSSNYVLTAPAPLAATITRKDLTIKVNDDAQFFTVASSNVGFNGLSYNGLVAGETSANLVFSNTSAPGVPNISTSLNATQKSTTGVYAGALTLDGTVTNNNYNITVQTGNFTVVGADQLLVRVNNVNTTYGSTANLVVGSAQYVNSNVNGTSNVLLNLSVNTVGNQVTVDDGLGSGGGAVMTLAPTVLAAQLSGSNNAKVGIYNIGATSLQPINGANFNNTVVVVGQQTVTAKALTATATAADKTYNSNSSASVTVTSTDVITGDNVSYAYTSAEFLNKNAGTNKAVTVANISLNGTDAGNYVIQNLVASTTANISQKALTVTGITADNKVYDGNTSAVVNVSAVNSTSLVTMGMVSGDNLTVAATGAFGNKNVGDGKTVTLTSTYSGADVGNYLITSQANTTANISQKTLTITGITADNKVYNGSNVATVNVSALNSTTLVGMGMVTGDNLTVAATGVFADKNVGTNKTVNLTSSYGGADAGNYNITSQVNTTANITAKDVTLAAPQATQVYNGSAIYTANATQLAALSAGLGVVDDSVTGVTLTYNNANAATGKTLTASNAVISDGNGGHNYNVSYTTNTTSVITAKDVTLSAPQATQVYNGSAIYTANATQLAALSTELGVVGDSVTGVTLTYNNANAATGKTLTASSAVINDGNGGHNYNVSYASNTTSVITAKDVTLAAPQATRAYDGTVNYTANATQLAALTAALGVAGDSVSNITLAYNNPNAATGKTLTASNVTISDGNNGSNYNVSYTSNTTSVITAKDVTLAAPQATRAYDGTANYTANATQLAALSAALGVAGDSVSNITLVYNDQNAATGKTLTASNVTISDGNSGHNYNVSYATNTTSVITAKDVTLAAPQATRSYDGTVNYTVNATQLAALTAALGVAGDSVSNISLAYNDKNAATGKTLTASGAVISDGNNGLNYNISYASNTTSVIMAKDVTLAAPQAARTYDGTVNYTANATQLAALTAALGVAGDSVSNISLAYNDKNAATGKTLTASNVTISDGNNGLNYNVSYTSNTTSVITIRDITLAAPQATRAYDGTVNYTANATQLAALSAALGGVGDSVSSITLTYNDKNAATGKTLTASNVTISDGNNGLNYNVSYTSNATSVITPKAITISGITAANKVYDGDTTAVVNMSAVNNTSLVGMGLVAGDNLSVAATGAFADKNVGNHKIVNLNSTYSGSDVGNYNITSQTSTWADITASTSSQNTSTSTSSGASQSQPATVDSAALVKSIAPPVITLPPAAVTVRVPLAMPSLNLPEATTTTAIATDNVKAKETKADATDDSMSSQKALALVTQTRAPVIETSNTPTTTLALPATPTALPTATAAATPAATPSASVSPSVTAAPTNTPPTLVASVAAPTSEVKVAPSGSAPPANQVASAPRASGVLPVSVLGDSRMANVGLAFEEQPNDIRIQMTASPDVPKLTATGVRFAGNFKTFMVGNDRGEMVTYQGAMIGKRMVVVAESEASKTLARQDMQTVLAAAITTLGSTGAISLSQMEGVVLDLR